MKSMYPLAAKHMKAAKKAYSRKSPGPARRANPENVERKKMRKAEKHKKELHKFLEVPEGKHPKIKRIK